MTVRWTILLLLLLAPTISSAQLAAGDLVNLRNKVVAEGSVEVKVSTRAVADAGSTLAGLTNAQRIAIDRAQDRILLHLLSQGLLVGNEITVQPDGSFTMRVLPAGLELLLANTEVAALEPATTQEGAKQ
jgi:hypothetical protein